MVTHGKEPELTEYEELEDLKGLMIDYFSL